MSDLSAQLAALGIPAPSSSVTVEPESPGDRIVRACTDYLAAGDAADPMVGLELHTMLVVMTARIAMQLAQHGCAIVRPAAPTKRLVKRTLRTTRGTEHGANSEEPDAVWVEEECKHELVEIDETRAQLTCRYCHVEVNAIWWLARHTKALTQSENWKVHVERKRREIEQEIAELKSELAATKAKNKRAGQTSAKQALRAEGSGYLVPPAPKRKRPPKR